MKIAIMVAYNMKLIILLSVIFLPNSFSKHTMIQIIVQSCLKASEVFSRVVSTGTQLEKHGNYSNKNCKKKKN